MLRADYFIGIDLHKNVVQACVLDATGSVVEEWRMRFMTPEEGQTVIERLSQWRQTGRVVVEAIGLNRWFVNACRTAGLALLVADPTKLGLKTLGRKTDRRDAYELARRLYLGDIERNATTYFAPDAEFGDRKLLRVRHQLVSIRQQVINQIRGLLHASLVPSPGASLYAARPLAQLKAIELPTASLTCCLHTLAATLEAVQTQITQLTDAIRARAKAPAVHELEQRLPSVGPQTALTLHAELGDLRRFRSAKEVAAYVGLTPRVRNSADTRHHGPVTKRGNQEVRWIVSQWAVRLLTRNAEGQAWARSRLRRMHMNKVRIMLARRLVVGLYVSHNRGEAFSLTRCLASA